MGAHVEKLMPIEEVSRLTGIPQRQVTAAWNSGLAKLGLDDVPLKMLKPMIAAWLESKEERPMIGCGSVECDRVWIERHGDYYDMETA